MDCTDMNVFGSELWYSKRLWYYNIEDLDISQYIQSFVFKLMNSTLVLIWTEYNAT